MTDKNIGKLIERIAIALERTAPPVGEGEIKADSDAFVWRAEIKLLEPVIEVNRVKLELLVGIENSRNLLLKNTERFAAGFSANNALLWGARGMGKSSLIKAVHAEVVKEKKFDLNLVEIHREDLDSLPGLLKILKSSNRKFILFCDDLSFDAYDASYKSLKAMLEGGIEGRPKNVLFYATSNRRHLMSREMIENEQSTELNPSETVEEKVSLSDRFGLWLGFHKCSQETFFEMLDRYVSLYGIKISEKTLRSEAIEWANTRGARSGRVAWQYIQDLAGRQNLYLD